MNLLNLPPLQASMEDDIAALARHLNTIDPDYGVHAAAFIAAGYKKAQELMYCKEEDVPTVPKGALRFILARTAGMKFRLLLAISQ